MTQHDDIQFRLATMACLRKAAIPFAGYAVAIACLLFAGGVYAAELSAQGAMDLGEKTIDLASKKDVVWLALAAAIFASASSIVQTVLLFKLTFAGVRAIDRMAGRPCQKMDNPWKVDP